tara:strand:+ start:1033 stop:1956 length:924 start_codon:yes stop_codon:yes gene_type:complete
MKIAFFTEGNWLGKVSRDNPNMRTEMAWMCTLNADHYNIHGGNIQGEYDLAVCIIPKKNPKFDTSRIRRQCKQVTSMQEGPHWYFQDYPLEQQIWYYNTLQEMDFLFVHNEIDKKYFQGLTNKKCKILPSLMIEDTLKDIPDNVGEGVMMGGNFCQWYGGFDSYIVAQQFGTDVTVPSMGRKIEGEEEMENLTHLSYLNWTNWIAELSKRKYGVHLMRTHAAGTFALNCAYLGIPCIGYKGLDTQEICHPNCTVEVGDLVKAKQIAEKLRIDEDFYLYCINTAKEKYKEHYHENKFNNTFKEQFKIS